MNLSIGSAALSLVLALHGGRELGPRDSVLDSMVGVQVEGLRSAALCTGTLVGPRTVLTAAHCFTGVGDYRASVIFGARPFQQSQRNASHQNYRASQVIIHPGYSPAEFVHAGPHPLDASLKLAARNATYDLALVILEKAVGHQPTPIVPSDLLMRLPVSVHQVGTGLEREEDEDAHLPSVENTKMKIQEFPLAVDKADLEAMKTVRAIPGAGEIYGNAFGDLGLNSKILFIVAEGSAHGMHGDSGGPFLTYYQGKPFVLGVYSEKLILNEQVNAELGVNVAEPQLNRWLLERIR